MRSPGRSAGGVHRGPILRGTRQLAAAPGAARGVWADVRCPGTGHAVRSERPGLRPSPARAGPERHLPASLPSVRPLGDVRTVMLAGRVDERFELPARVSPRRRGRANPTGPWQGSATVITNGGGRNTELDRLRARLTSRGMDMAEVRAVGSRGTLGVR